VSADMEFVSDHPVNILDKFDFKGFRDCRN